MLYINIHLVKNNWFKYMDFKAFLLRIYRIQTTTPTINLVKGLGGTDELMSNHPNT